MDIEGTGCKETSRAQLTVHPSIVILAVIRTSGTFSKPNLVSDSRAVRQIRISAYSVNRVSMLARQIRIIAVHAV